MMGEMAETEKLIKTEPIENTYLVKEELGRGRFAVVRRCIRKVSGEEFAAKFIRKARAGRRGREQLLLEIDILHKSSHQKLVRLYDVFETKSEIILILEYAAGGDLHKHCLEQIDTVRTEKEICNLVRQIVEAVRYLHDMRVVHLDLKPENILLKSSDRKFPEVKLIDFGLSRRLDVPYSQFDIVGTPEYVAPEVLSYEPLEISADMWSIGVVTYVLLSGISPFAGDDVMETYGNISQVDYDFDAEEFDELSDDAKDFIDSLLIKEPQERISARESLEHPWLKQLEDGVTAEDIADALKMDTLTPSCSKSKTIELNPFEEEGLVEDLIQSSDEGLEDHEEESSEGQNEQDIELDASVCTNNADNISKANKEYQEEIKSETPDNAELIEEITNRNEALDKDKDFTCQSVKANIDKEEIKSDTPESTELIETKESTHSNNNENKSSTIELIEENKDTCKSITTDRDEGFAVEIVKTDQVENSSNNDQKTDQNEKEEVSLNTDSNSVPAVKNKVLADKENLSTNDQKTDKNEKEEVSLNTDSNSGSAVNNKVLADKENLLTNDQKTDKSEKVDLSLNVDNNSVSNVNNKVPSETESNSSKQISTKEQIQKDVTCQSTKDTNVQANIPPGIKKSRGKSPRSISLGLECKMEKRGSFSKVKERFESGGIYKEKFGGTKSTTRKSNSGENSPSLLRKTDSPLKVKSLENLLSDGNKKDDTKKVKSLESLLSDGNKKEDTKKLVKSHESVLSERSKKEDAKKVVKSPESVLSEGNKKDDTKKVVKSPASVLSEGNKKDDTNTPTTIRQNSPSRTTLQLKLDNESPKAGPILIKQGSLNKRKDKEQILLQGQAQTLHVGGNIGAISPSSTPSTPSSGSRTPDSGRGTPTSGSRTPTSGSLTPSSDGHTPNIPTANGSRTPPLSSSIKKPVGVRQGIAAQMASKFANIRSDNKTSTPIKRPISTSPRVSGKMKEHISSKGSVDDTNDNDVKTPVITAGISVKEHSFGVERESKPDNINKTIETEQDNKTAIRQNRSPSKLKKDKSIEDEVGIMSIAKPGALQVISIPVGVSHSVLPEEKDDEICNEVIVQRRASATLPRGGAQRSQDRPRSRTIKEKGEGGSPSSPRKIYRRLYVTHVKGSKSIDIEGDPLDEVAELKTSFERDDSLQVQLVLKCGEIKFGTL